MTLDYFKNLSIGGVASTLLLVSLSTSSALDAPYLNEYGAGNFELGVEGLDENLDIALIDSNTDSISDSVNRTDEQFDRIRYFAVYDSALRVFKAFKESKGLIVKSDGSTGVQTNIEQLTITGISKWELKPRPSINDTNAGGSDDGDTSDAGSNNDGSGSDTIDI